jgi:transcriptional regulator GlxA family with amidase domain
VNFFAVRKENLGLIPARVDDVSAAGIPVACLSAHMTLGLAGLQAGTTQLARAMGAKPAISSATNHEKAEDYRREDADAIQNVLPRPLLRRVLERIEKDLDTDLDLKMLSKESGYSKNHFLRMFRAATGYTPYQYVLHSRVKRAQVLLKDKSMRLIDIALACGFSSHAQFSWRFRQVMGISPSEYRRHL